MIDTLLEELEKYNKNDIHSLVGYFPECKLTRGTGSKKQIIKIYQESEIYLKYGFQHPTEEHKGFGIKHILSAHRNETIYREIKSFNDVSNILIKALKKNSKIYIENYHTDKTIVISSMMSKTEGVKVVLEWLSDEKIYSVVTCYTISPVNLKQFSTREHAGKIKKTLDNEKKTS